MNIDLMISADDIKSEKLKTKNVIVIDMLRATSVITTALNNGCEEVIPVLSIDEAVSIAEKDRKRYILGGERNALKIEGFDFSNSPLDYTKDNIEGKTLIITTSNGTRAIKGSLSAENIYIAAMINGKAVADRLVKEGKDVVIVNAGTAGEFSMDDFICSGYIINCIREKKADLQMSDLARTALYVYDSNPDIIGFVKYAKHFNRIKELGLIEDLEYCCSKDLIGTVPQYKNGVIKL